MPSIKQVIAELQLAPELTDRQKTVIKRLIDEAVERLKLKEKPVRRASNRKAQCTLDEWEAKRGKQLHYTDFEVWASRNNIAELSLREMIENFREQMFARATPYADFTKAFLVYLRNGYLPKRLEDCRVKEHTHIDNRGVTL